MQTVLVNRKSNGNGKLVPGRERVERIVAVYEGGTVKTASGDVWRVKRSESSRATFQIAEAYS